jgi:pyridoxine kinase
MAARGAVLVISSQVARGSVGNRAMMFALERLGYSVWAVPTVLLPHHPGHGPAERIAIEDTAFAGLLDMLVADGRAGEIAGIVSGYFASPGQALTVRRIIETVKVANADALYLCDPVIGDAGKLYVGEALAETIRDALLPLADFSTPNAFECFWLAGAAGSNAELATLAQGLPSPATLVTSAPALMRNAIGNLLVTGSETILFEHPQLATPVKGTGDLLSALLLARKLSGHDWPKATELALSSVFEIVAGTAKTGADELMLAELQNSLVHPHAPISVRRMGSSRVAQAAR